MQTRKKRRTGTGRRLSALLLSCALVCTTGVMPSAAAEPERQDITFPTGENCTEEGGVYTLRNTDGNNLALSDVYADTFDYSADVKLIEGEAVTVVFGHDGGNRFHGVELRQAGEDILVSSFVDGDSSIQGSNRIFENLAVEDQNMTEDFVNVHLTMDESSKLTVEVADTPVSEYTFAENSSDGIAYYGGRLGILTWKAEAQFKNFAVTASASPDQGNGFDTNIEGSWTPYGGSWRVTDEGVLADNQNVGDTFYMSSLRVEPGTTYAVEGELRLEAGQAGGIVFAAPDRENPGAQWYCLNIDTVDKVSKLLGSSSIAYNYSLSEEELQSEVYKLCVEVIDGRQINAYVNGKLTASKVDESFPGGYVGIMSFQSRAVFDNVNLYTADTAPALTGMEIPEMDLSPAFSAGTFQYRGTVPYETDTLHITAEVSEGAVLSVNGESAVSGESAAVSLETGNNVVQIKAEDPETGISCYTTVNVYRRQSADEAYTEPYRPQYHFSPETMWGNDPNGLVYFEGEWHLFYQCNPDQKVHGPMYWAHAVSTDLIHWEQLPIALEPDDLGPIFSGSCVVDKDNTTGFFDGIEGGGLVAIYTYDDPAGQKQAIAYSTDKGRTWTKYEGNPVIAFADDPLGDTAFRDPKVFWHEESQQWMMVVAGGPLRFYSSKNLIDWKFESGYDNAHPEYRPEGTASIYTECPDFFKLEVGDTGEYKWVLSGGGRFYMIGDFVQNENGNWWFVPDSNEQYVMNYGKDSYAAMTYFGWDENGTPDGRRIMINWMSNWDYCNDLSKITDPYNGIYNLQIELTLEKIGDEIRLIQTPISEYESLRQTDEAVNINTTLTPGGENPLEDFSGKQYEVVAEFKPGENTKRVGFKLRTGGDQETLVYYNLEDGKMYLDRTSSGQAPNDKFLEIYSQKTSMTEDGTIRMRIFVDWSSVEVFGNDGETVGSALIFPDETSLGAEVYTVGDTAELSAVIYPMASIWRDSSETPEDPDTPVDPDTPDTPEDPDLPAEPSGPSDSDGTKGQDIPAGNGTGSQNAGAGKGTPKTGDSMTMLYGMLTAAALSGAAAVWIGRKKRRI